MLVWLRVEDWIVNTPVGELLRAKGNAVETIAPMATVQEAVRRMSVRRIGCLAVVSKQGRLSGLISERDCLWRTLAAGKTPRNRCVRECMTPLSRATIVTPSHTVEECMRLITGGRQRHLLVLDGNRLAGVVSIGDVVKFLIGDRQATIESLEKYIEGTL